VKVLDHHRRSTRTRTRSAPSWWTTPIKIRDDATIDERVRGSATPIRRLTAQAISATTFRMNYWCLVDHELTVATPGRADVANRSGRVRTYTQFAVCRRVFSGNRGCIPIYWSNVPVGPRVVVAPTIVDPRRIAREHVSRYGAIR